VLGRQHFGKRKDQHEQRGSEPTVAHQYAKENQNKKEAQHA
jgi:hypothetical protein